MDGKVMSKKTCKRALIQDWNERVFFKCRVSSAWRFFNDSTSICCSPIIWKEWMASLSSHSYCMHVQLVFLVKLTNLEFNSAISSSFCSNVSCICSASRDSSMLFQIQKHAKIKQTKYFKSCNPTVAKTRLLHQVNHGWRILQSAKLFLLSTNIFVFLTSDSSSFLFRVLTS